MEKKYRMNQATYQKILPIIEENMGEDSHCLGGKSYRICNLYYDTPGDDVIRQSLKKPFFKEKLRMRSYGYPESEESRVFLELKRKINGIVTKRRATLSYGVALRFLENRQIPEDLSYINRQVLCEIREYLSHTELTSGTLISYDRRAFFSRENPDFRVTFDRNIRYKRGILAIRSDAEKDLAPITAEDFILMEAKVEGAYPLWFAHLLGEKGICPQSFSKYGVAYKTWLKKERFGGEESIDVFGRL